MLPNITAMLAGMAVQVLVFIRTFAISGRSKLVFFGLGGLLLLCFPVQVFGITYHRDPYLSKGSCKGKVLRQGEPDWNIVYYSAHMVFDLSACVTATTYLILISRSREHLTHPSSCCVFFATACYTRSRVPRQSMGSYGVCWRIFLRRCVDPSSRRCDDRRTTFNSKHPTCDRGRTLYHRRPSSFAYSKR
ncbi:hypothetical protein B0H13DRAFT_910846 [Mycena leptocephala]|nr:hypothetical protein B0H13DRAFT_910846 [Mycena leptocephala]